MRAKVTALHKWEENLQSVNYVESRGIEQGSRKELYKTAFRRRKLMKRGTWESRLGILFLRSEMCL
jgi:hypothetical protein